MGWMHQDDDGSHEAWVVAVLPDGSDGTRDGTPDTTTDVALPENLEWAWSLKYDGAHGHPRAMGVRVVCACGWKGGRKRPTWNAPAQVDDQLRAQWRHHAEVALADTLPEDVQRLVVALHDAVGALVGPAQYEGDEVRPLAVVHAATLLKSMADTWQAEAVQAARGDYSWEEIAGALGTSKQSAHERFSR
ncbi:hypothetical protein [Streptomyces vinaceus]|uniref:hypothetical protein n=1 Tax=Streptomyces vinaceus TaxID=1960 RepID=UPI00380E7061